jgi:hypothetical protein
MYNTHSHSDPLAPTSLNMTAEERDMVGWMQNDMGIFKMVVEAPTTW